MAEYAPLRGLTISTNRGCLLNFEVRPCLDVDGTGPRRALSITNTNMEVHLPLMAPVDLLRLGEFLRRQSGLVDCPDAETDGPEDRSC